MDFDKLRTLPGETQEELNRIRKGILALATSEIHAGTVSFECTCGAPLTITKRVPESIMSGTFCQQCGEQWNIRWSVGELHRGKIH